MSLMDTSRLPLRRLIAIMLSLVLFLGSVPLLPSLVSVSTAVGASGPTKTVVFLEGVCSSLYDGTQMLNTSEGVSTAAPQPLYQDLQSALKARGFANDGSGVLLYGY